MALSRTPEAQFVIGVDGGGTKTEAVLAIADPDSPFPIILATQITGPSNLQRQPIEASLHEVTLACNALLDQIPNGTGEVAAGCFAMAGSGNEHIKAQFQAWLNENRWLRRSMVTHDARAVLAAGTLTDSGIALIAGTGSIAYARTVDGQESRCGGWQGLVGDEGSAYWMARQGFRSALRAFDGRGPATRLVADLAVWLDNSAPQHWPYQLSLMKREMLAAAARVVTHAAEAQDTVALSILDSAVEELALLVTTLAVGQFRNTPVEIALAGGLLCHCSLMRDKLREALAKGSLTLARFECVTKPASGAARIALQALATGPN
jgi:N-acetylmuramic acid 6-phosphate etherase